MGGRMPAWRGGGHLQFAGEVVGEQAGQEVEWVAASAAHRHVAHLAVALELAEDTFLRTAAFVEADDGMGPQRLVGDDDLEVIAVPLGDEQVQLARPLRSHPLRFQSASKWDASELTRGQR